MTLGKLEQEIDQALQHAGRQQVYQLCQAMGPEMMKQEKDRNLRGMRGPLHLLTRFGWKRIYRWQVCEKEAGYCHPLDELLGLNHTTIAAPRSSTSLLH